MSRGWKEIAQTNEGGQIFMFSVIGCIKEILLYYHLYKLYCHMTNNDEQAFNKKGGQQARE